MTTDITPIVAIKNNAVVANSRDVAAYFGKATLQRPSGHRCPHRSGTRGRIEFSSLLLSSCRRGRSYRAFDMTRDGFTLLVMGFTGEKALQLKLRYIEQFNAMEAELKARLVVTTPAIPTNFVEALRLAPDQHERRLAAGEYQLRRPAAGNSAARGSEDPLRS